MNPTPLVHTHNYFIINGRDFYKPRVKGPFPHAKNRL